MMWEKIKSILWRLFGKKTVLSDLEIAAQGKFGRDYQQADDLNFTAIFANKLACLAVSESTVSVDGKNPRAQFIGARLQSVWDSARKITARALGTGGVVLAPYAAGGRIYTDVIPQDRFFINSMQGGEITSASILADAVLQDGKRFTRYTDYTLEGRVYIIRTRAECEGRRVPLSAVPQWAGIAEEVRIANVDRMLFTHLKCPADNRREDGLYGVPVTYGCGRIIRDIQACMEQIREEFAQKRVRVFADEAMFGPGDEIEGSLFKRFMAGGSLESGPFFEVFDPAIRESAYYSHLLHLFSLLEKAVGVSKGILTEQETQGATATEIKRAAYDTYAMVESIRKNWEKAARELAYAYSVLAEFYGLTPPGEFTVRWDWSYALIESGTESWQQMVAGMELGVIKKEELRQFIRPNESIEDARRAIRDIEAAQTRKGESASAPAAQQAQAKDTPDRAAKGAGAGPKTDAAAEAGSGI